MFKKKVNNEKNSYYEYKPFLTVPFTVSYKDENPKKMKKMKKEIKKQEKEDPTNPDNIISILEKSKKRNLKKLSGSQSMPCIRSKYDIKVNSSSVQLGRNIIERHISNGIPLIDIETGEQIRPEFFTTNWEIANVTYQTGALRRINLNSRPRFIYFVN